MGLSPSEIGKLFLGRSSDSEDVSSILKANGVQHLTGYVSAPYQEAKLHPSWSIPPALQVATGPDRADFQNDADSANEETRLAARMVAFRPGITYLDRVLHRFTDGGRTMRSR